MTLPRFTLVGATTRTGLLTSPLRDRFGIVLRLDYYTPEELAEIVRRSALRLEVEISARSVPARSASGPAGTPRIANRLLRRVRDFAEVEGTGAIDRAATAATCADPPGRGRRWGWTTWTAPCCARSSSASTAGPVGIESLAAAVSEESDTLEDVYEPYLIQEGFMPAPRAAGWPRGGPTSTWVCRSGLALSPRARSSPSCSSPPTKPRGSRPRAPGAGH